MSTWKNIARVPLCDIRLRCEFEARIDVNEETGEERVRKLIACADGTVRPLGRTGKEGARRAACQQVKVNYVPVVSPIIDRRMDGSPISQREDALNKIRAMYHGTALEAKIGDDGFAVYEDIGCNEAARRYGQMSHDVCERIPGGSRD